MNPIPFYQSRYFWTALLDAVITLILFFVGKYQPAVLEDVKVTIVALQTIFVFLIVSYTREDTALINAGFYRSREGLVKFK